MSSTIQLCPYCRKQIVRPRPGVKFHTHCARVVDKLRVDRPRVKTHEQAEATIDIEAGKAGIERTTSEQAFIRSRTPVDDSPAAELVLRGDENGPQL